MNQSDEMLLDAVADAVGRGDKPVLTVRGRSMLPYLHPDAERVELAAPGDVRCGDIVLARVDAGGRYVLHRVVDMAPDGSLTLMGDANLHLREHCRRADVAGVVSMVIADDGVRRRPSRAWLWRKLWRMRPLFVKLLRMR